MSNPVILAVDDDPEVAAAITRDLRGRYGADYRVVRTTSGPEALDVLAKLALRGQAVALMVADQRMPQMTGIEMLEQARAHALGAKYLLLTAYADTDVAGRWPLPRALFALETSMPGVFAAGDVRLDS